VDQKPAEEELQIHIYQKHKTNKMKKSKIRQAIHERKTDLINEMYSSQESQDGRFVAVM
jgi:hypothetical protein